MPAASQPRSNQRSSRTGSRGRARAMPHRSKPSSRAFALTRAASLPGLRSGCARSSISALPGERDAVAQGEQGGDEPLGSEDDSRVLAQPGGGGVGLAARDRASPQDAVRHQKAARTEPGQGKRERARALFFLPVEEDQVLRLLEAGERLQAVARGKDPAPIENAGIAAPGARAFV